MSEHTHIGKAKLRPVKGTLFLPYQTRWIEDASRLKIMEKSRQIGMSWSTAYAIVRRAILEGEKLDTWVSSRDETQARLFLEDCKAFASMLNIGAEDLGERVLDEKGASAFVLHLANGRRIHSMSSNPDAQAGKRGTRVLDEFALHPDPRKLYSIAYPGITWGGQLEIISTHRGSENLFNQLIDEARNGETPKGISLHRVTLEDALAEGFLYKLQQKLPHNSPIQQLDEAAYFDYIRRGCIDEETFQQEYCCVPANDNAAFLPYELIDSCLYRNNEYTPADSHELANMPGLDLTIGVDVGRRRDLTVIWVLGRQRGTDVYHTKAVVELKGMPFSEQEAILWPWLELPNMRRCCIDATGLGMQFAERAQQHFGTYRVEPVNFTGAVKVQLAFPLRSAFEDRALRIPSDRHIIADLRKLRKTTTASGNIRFEAERDSEGHADRFWALALALHAGMNPTAPTYFEPIPRGGDRLSARSRSTTLL